ncbi:MAG: tetratricopeptide repeat protein, partial [Planctomycetota bacterium]|nr:tetratricopeptide repeat protein [Planctomycetota bacterium]
MRVNGVRVRVKRVAGALTLALGLCFVGGFVTGRLLTSPTGPQEARRSEALTLPHEIKTGDLDPEPDAHLEMIRPLLEVNLPLSFQRPSSSELYAAQEIAKIEAAHKTLSKTIDESFDPHDALIERGKLYFTLTLYERARKDFHRAIDLKDDSFEGYLGRGKAFIGLGEFEEAECDITEAIDLSGAQATGFRERARLFQEVGKYSEAQKDFEVARTRDANDLSILKELAVLCEDMNDLKKAETYYLEFAESGSPEQGAFAWFALKRLASVQGKACPRLAPFKQLDSDRPELLIASAQLSLQAKENWDAAREDLGHALISLEREAKVRAHFQSWRISSKAVLAQSERLYKEALMLRVILETQRSASVSNQSPELHELLIAFPNSMEAALAHYYVTKSSLSSASYSQRLQQSQSHSAKAFRQALPEAFAPHRFEHAGPGYFQKKCQALSSLVYRNPWHFQARLERAKVCFQENHELGRVSYELKTLLTKHPENWGARLVLAQCLLKSGDKPGLSDAADEFGKAIEQLKHSCRSLDSTERDSHIAEAYFGRSQVSQLQFKAGYIESSINSIPDLSLAISRVPRENARGLTNAMKYYQARADRYLEQQNFEASGKDLMSLELCRREAKKRALHHQKLALKARGKREYSEAIGQFNIALDYDATNAQAIYDRGITFLKIGNFVPGILDLVKA